MLTRSFTSKCLLKVDKIDDKVSVTFEGLADKMAELIEQLSLEISMRFQSPASQPCGLTANCVCRASLSISPVGKLKELTPGYWELAQIPDDYI